MKDNNISGQINSEPENENAIEKYLPIVKFLGTSVKQFFVSGQFKKTIRSPAQFVNPRNFENPKSLAKALQNFDRNRRFYTSNYFIITGATSVLKLVFGDPISLVIMLVLSGMWSYIFRTSDSSLKIGENKYGPTQKFLFGIIFTVIAILFFGILGSIVSGLCIGAGISFIHGACHIRPITENEKLRSINDIELENSNKFSGSIQSANINNSNSVNGIQMMNLNHEFDVNAAGNAAQIEADKLINDDNINHHSFVSNDDGIELGLDEKYGY